MARYTTGASARFDTNEDRMQALLLNERGWHGCRKCQHWSDLPAGEMCPCGEAKLRAERRPDKGSVFAEQYAEFKRTQSETS